MLTGSHSRTSRQSQRLKNDHSSGLTAGARLLLATGKGLAVMNLLTNNTISQAFLLMYMHSHSYKHTVSHRYWMFVAQWLGFCAANTNVAGSVSSFCSFLMNFVLKLVLQHLVYYKLLEKCWRAYLYYMTLLSWAAHTYVCNPNSSSHKYFV